MHDSMNNSTSTTTLYDLSKAEEEKKQLKSLIEELKAEINDLKDDRATIINTNLDNSRKLRRELQEKDAELDKLRSSIAQRIINHADDIQLLKREIERLDKRVYELHNDFPF